MHTYSARMRDSVYVTVTVGRVEALYGTPPTSAVRKAKAPVTGTGSHSLPEGKSFCLSSSAVILENISEEPHPREVV